ncbi:MAG TPA: glycosyl transferase family 90 [Chitinophagaceae bacterium]|nr:glycosyl transferase family 90 [Chitinophagaceae bacterium]
MSATRIYKQNKFLYYTRNIVRQAMPKTWYENRIKNKLAAITGFDKATLLDRVNYYNKLQQFTAIGERATALNDLKIFERPKTYKFDAFEYTRYFDDALKAQFIFGDVTHVHTSPAIQKSRPIAGNNANAVLLKLNKARHFVFVKDAKPFAVKQNKLIGRSSIYQEHRMRFMQQYFNHPRCDLGQTNREGGNPDWLKRKRSIADHLDYKFILSLEGNDVATNLKWIMSSNSVAVMPKPKYETWFMEGRLLPDVHYISLKDDFSDLEEKLDYYSANEAAAQQIIRNANRHAAQFLNKKQEDLIALLVLRKYFYYTQQSAEYELL